MKSPFVYAVAGVGVAFLLALTQPERTHAQAPAPVEDPAVTALVGEVVAQQALLQANQTAMDEKIATIAEEVRQARLFVARGGGAAKP